MEEKIKKGDVVCIYDKYKPIKETRIVETTVVSVGRKYITTEYDKHNKFNSESLYSDWGGYALFKGTKEECEAYLLKTIEAKKMCREIRDYFDLQSYRHNYDFDLINHVYNLIFKNKS